MRRLWLVVTFFTICAPAWAQSFIDPQVKAYSVGNRPPSREAQEAVLSVLDTHAALPLNLRLSASDLATNWMIRTSDGRLGSDTLGYGVNVVSYPNISVNPLRALPTTPIDLTAGGAFTTETKIAYFSDEESLRTTLSDDTGFSLGFQYAQFGLSADFQSGHMQSNQRKKNRRFFVVSYFGTQWFSATPGGLTTEAANFWRSRGRTAFYGRYGTHYISRVQLKAHLSIVYSFSSDSEEVLENFSNDAGLKLSYGGFGVGITNTIKDTLANYKSSVDIHSDIFMSGHAANGLPQIIALEGDTILEGARQFILNLATDRAGLPVVQYVITPFAAFDRDIGPLTKLALAGAATANEEIQSTLHDAKMILDYQGFYNVTLATQLAFNDKLEAIRGRISSAMQTAIESTSVNDAAIASQVQTAIREWTLFINDPANTWPFDPVGPTIEFKKLDMPAGSFEATIRTPRSEVSELNARLIAIKFAATGAPADDPKALSTTSNLSYQSKTAGDVTSPSGSGTVPGIIYVTQPIPIPSDTKDEMWLEVIDRKGRSFTHLVSTKLGPLVTDNVPETQMVAGPR